MTRVLWLAAGPMQWYSSKARVHWVAERMPDTKDVPWNEATDADFDGADVVVFQKYHNAQLAKALQDSGRAVVWDICDPMHWFDPQAVRDFLPHVDAVVCSNPGLEQDFREWSGGVVPVQTIADRVKLEHYPSPRIHIPTDPIRIIWFGLGVNRFTLMAALPVLERAIKNGHRIELTIQDDRPQENWQYVSRMLNIYHVQFLWDCEYKVLHGHDIAVLPKYPGEWGKVKSNNKDLTAWACGLPVTRGDSYKELVSLFDPMTRQVIAEENYKELTDNWLIEQSVKEWEALCASL